jgi:hypothetical protein
VEGDQLRDFQPELAGPPEAVSPRHAVAVVREHVPNDRGSRRPITVCRAGQTQTQQGAANPEVKKRRAALCDAQVIFVLASVPIPEGPLRMSPKVPILATDIGSHVRRAGASPRASLLPRSTFVTILPLF